MIAQNMAVKFITPGMDERTFVCDYVIFGYEILNNVLELLDGSLHEDWDDDPELRGRQTIELRVKLDLMEAMFMWKFLRSPDKTLVIDNMQYDVVNADRMMSAPLFKETNIGVHPKLKFRCKNLGLVTPTLKIGGTLPEGVI